MRRTPDPSTAKRGRSEELETPISRQRISSPELQYGTPAFETPRGNTAQPGDSNLGNKAEKEIGEEFNWNRSMEEEELGRNLSSSLRLNAQNSFNDGTDGTETIDDQMINRMIEEKIDRREEEDKGVMTNQ